MHSASHSRFRYETPLRAAISGGHLDIVRYIVEEHQIDLNEGRPDSGSLPHNYAASLGNLELVRYLVRCGRGLTVTRGSSRAWTERHGEPDTDSFVLRSACESGNVELVKFVLDEGCDVNSPDPINGGTPIECACASGSLEIVRLIHERGASINVGRHCECCRDWTPLHEACAAGSAEVVDYLLRNGSTQIDTQCTGKDSITPLDLAFESDQMDVAKVLFVHGSTLYCNRQQFDLRQQFIRYAFGFRNGWTNLQLCADMRNHDLARWLLSRGLADPAMVPLGSQSAAALAAIPSKLDDALPDAETLRLMKLASMPWRVSNHMLFGPGYRRAAHELLLVEQSLSRRSSPLGLPALPIELWFKIISMMKRSDHDDVAPVRRVRFGRSELDVDELRVVVVNIGDLLLPEVVGQLEPC